MVSSMILWSILLKSDCTWRVLGTREELRLLGSWVFLVRRRFLAVYLISCISVYPLAVCASDFDLDSTASPTSASLLSPTLIYIFYSVSIAENPFIIYETFSIVLPGLALMLVGFMKCLKYISFPASNVLQWFEAAAIIFW
jgi:hypothetical protein